MGIYEVCPVIESEKFLLRMVKNEDCEELLRVYSDKNSLPFFNSDGCDGDNFYYATKKRMTEALDFWKLAYENGWFARLSIIIKLCMVSLEQLSYVYGYQKMNLMVRGF